MKFGYGQQYDSFWYSGGRCYFTDGYSESHIEQGEWGFDTVEGFEKYQKEIEEVFQYNVSQGCCGGCL